MRVTRPIEKGPQRGDLPHVLTEILLAKVPGVGLRRSYSGSCSEGIFALLRHSICGYPYEPWSLTCSARQPSIVAPDLTLSALVLPLTVKPLIPGRHSTEPTGIEGKNRLSGPESHVHGR